MIPLFLVLLIPLHVSASDSVYETFVQCLSNQTNQPDQVSNIVYSQANPSFTTVLRAYIRNSRNEQSIPTNPRVHSGVTRLLTSILSLEKLMGGLMYLLLAWDLQLQRMYFWS
ncbi:hypothetical protein CMV_011265 [Castanea mollissima]|uniref:Uncharacterized protein n=1 Tax=Castanea mollissima TaxID=60419 RepID=A0A8J4RHR7_9ROSI|nr:hypothetical protein CMV_011265 [Castanea mollissima]